MPSDQARDFDSYCLVKLEIAHNSQHLAKRERYDTRTIKLSAPNQPVSIGRSSKRAGSRGPPCHSNAIFDSPVVSRDHAQFCLNSAKHLFITDLDSMHGTFVNGQKLESRLPMLLHTDDCITIGSSVTPITGQEYTAVAFTVDITFFPAPLVGPALSELDQQTALEGTISVANEDTTHLGYGTSCIPIVPSSDNLDSPPLSGSSVSHLEPSSKSSRRINSIFSVPSDSSFDSDDDDESGYNCNDTTWPEETPQPCEQVSTSLGYTHTSPVLEATPCSPNSSFVSPPLYTVTASPVYSTTSSLSAMSNDEDRAHCRTQSQKNFPSATTGAGPQVRQEDDQTDMSRDMDALLNEQDDLTESGLLHDLAAVACPAISLHDRKDDFAQHPDSAINKNESNRSTHTCSIASPYCVENIKDTNKAAAAYQRLPDDLELKSCDVKSPASEYPENSQDSPVSDLDTIPNLDSFSDLNTFSDLTTFVGQKRRMVDDDNIAGAEPELQTKESTHSVEQVPLAKADSPYKIVIAAEPARKRVRFETQATAIQDRTTHTRYEATISEQTRGYLPNVVSFTLGTLVGSAAMVGGLLALPDSFFL